MLETNMRESGLATSRKVSIKADQNDQGKVQSRQQSRRDQRSTTISNFRRPSHLRSFARVEIPLFPKPRRSPMHVDSDHKLVPLSEFGNPMEHVEGQLSLFVNRNERDSVYMRNGHWRKANVAKHQSRRIKGSTDEGINFELKEPHDEDDVLSRQPSYRKFRIPLEVIAHQRVLCQQQKYEEQFQYEMQQLINYQATALDASSFVRVMAYTTFWPPLHNESELEYTSKRLFRLTSKERSRLKFIMNNEFH